MLYERPTHIIYTFMHFFLLYTQWQEIPKNKHVKYKIIDTNVYTEQKVVAAVIDMNDFLQKCNILYLA